MSAALFKKARVKVLTAVILGAFSTGAPGWVYDNSDQSTLYQDVNGMVPVTALEQPVALQWDKKQNVALGPELVGDPGFDNPGYWAVGAGWAVTGGAGVATAAGSSGISKAGILTIGKWYKATITVNVTSGSVYLPWDASAAFDKIASVSGTYTRYFLAATTTLYAAYGATPFTGSIDNISVKEVKGAHRYQTTSANRTTWSARYNGAIKTENLADVAWTKANTTITSDAVLDPNGLMTVDKICETAATGAFQVSQAIAVPANAVVSMTFQAAERSKLIFYAGSGSYADTVKFDIATGVFSAVGANITATRYYRQSNGNTRIEVTRAAAAAGTIVYIGLLNAAGSESYTGSAGSGLYAWGLDSRPYDQSFGLIPAYQWVDTAASYDSSPLFPRFLRYNGSNSWMQNNSNDFTGTNKVSVFVGVRKLSGAAQGILCELGPNALITAKTFAIYAPNAAGSYAALAYQLQLSGLTCTTYTEPITNVLSVLFNTSANDAVANQIFPRFNGALPGATVVNGATGTGAGTFGNLPAYFGARAGTSLFFNGMEFCNIAIGTQLNAANQSVFEQFTNIRTRAYA